MLLFKKIIEKIYIGICIKYIEFVYKTSKIVKTGYPDFWDKKSDEKFLISFWHGESYAFYPLLINTKQLVITTADKRGDYISQICNYFGYSTIRVPDKSQKGNYIYDIKKRVKQENSNLIFTLDGPLGPYHEPKKLPFLMAYLLNYRLITIALNIDKKIQLTNRWDNYVIPLPFNKIQVQVNSPLKFDRNDVKLQFQVKREMVKRRMNAFFI